MEEKTSNFKKKFGQDWDPVAKLAWKEMASRAASK